MGILFGDDRTLSASMKKNFALQKAAVFSKEDAATAPYVIRDYIVDAYKNENYPLKSVLICAIEEEQRKKWKSFLRDIVCRVDYTDSSKNPYPYFDTEQEYELLVITDASIFTPVGLHNIIDAVNSKTGNNMLKIAIIEAAK
jgi:hypothetical protein